MMQSIFYNEEQLPPGKLETTDNYEAKLPLLFILDVSKSMEGRGIRQLYRGLQEFESFFINDPVALARLEVGIISFSTEARVEQSFSSIGKQPLPKMTAGGRTNMIDAIKVGLQLIDQRKRFYKSKGSQYYRPYIVLITDGSPWPNKNLGNLPEEIRSGTENNQFVFQAFGAGRANMSILNKLSHSDYPPQMINEYDFENLFMCLSPSISKMIRG